MKKQLASLIMCLFLTAGTAFAADWNFYGSSRITSFVTDTDNPGSTADTKTLEHTLQGNARIGANVAVNDAIKARFEYGTGVNIRHLFAEWDFGPGKLLVGQTMSPLNITPSVKTYGGDEGMFNYGAVYAGRQPMLELNFGNFKVAAVRPTSDDLGVAGAVIEFAIPKLEARYTFKFNSGHFHVAGGYNRYDLTDPSTGVTHDVDSLIGAIGGKAELGRYFVGGDIWAGRNTGPYNFRCAAEDMPIVSGSSLIDIDGWGYLLVAGMKLNQMFSFETGYGHVTSEPDNGAYSEDEVGLWYIQSTVTFAPGVFIVPEVGIIDNKTDNTGAEEPEILYYGMKWQINF